MEVDSSLDIRVQLLQFCSDIQNCGASQAVVADLEMSLSWNPRHRIRVVPWQGRPEFDWFVPERLKGSTRPD